ncbi:hypothetical protein PsYK624_133690 [Phanerochaete sordida]|uniref:Uncharacterized protein n=1 Tax=Phanerochaete sordida TaxID=48140 RepID=A0A9P3GKV9_9APHY|nr:hypothetical protein PsYK624_133690 [Phanerochaete sordida]
MTLLRPTLTHLEVNGCMASPTASLSISKWLRLLRNLPILQKLHLYDAISSTSNDSARIPSSAIELPQLRRIALRQTRGHTTSTLCAHLLAHLSYPITAETQLLVSQPALNFEAYAGVVSIPSNRINTHKLASSHRLPLYTHLSLISHDAYGFGGQIEFTLTSSMRSDQTSPGPLSISLLLKRDSFRGPIWGVDVNRSTDEALCYLAATPLAADVTHLSLNPCPRPARDSSGSVAEYYRTWLYLYATGLRLQSLTLSPIHEHLQIHAFLNAAQRSLDVKTAFFPELRTLTMRGLDPRCLVDGLAVPGSLEWNLVRAFQERRKRGDGPTCLKLEDGFSKEMDQIRLLKASDEGEPMIDFLEGVY